MSVEHPDDAWLLSVVESIESWRGTRVSTPTSQLTGGGAVHHAEDRLAGLHEGRPTLLMPSATYALWVALRTLGVGPGDEVLLPRYDWTSSLAGVEALGAVPVIVPTDPATLTIDPAQAAARRTARTRAVVATHLFGIPADVPALRNALAGVPVLEDCSQAFGSTLDGRAVGALGDAAVFSFGPGKRIDVGELGALVLRDAALREQALLHSGHPIRQQLAGIWTRNMAGLSIRPHPLSAVLLNVALDRDDAGALIEARRMLAAQLLTSGLGLIGVDPRRGVASRSVPTVVDAIDEDRLPAGTRTSHADLIDIESVQDGYPLSRRVAFVSPAPHDPEERR